MMDWGTISAVVGVVGTGGGFVIRAIYKLRTNDLHHIERELAHVVKAIEELKAQDRCGRKEHDAIRRDMAERDAKIYERIEAHTRWHLEQKA